MTHTLLFIFYFFVSRCLVDVKLTGSTFSFMCQIQSDKQQFQLEAFRFKRDGGLVCNVGYSCVCSSTDHMSLYMYISLVL